MKNIIPLLGAIIIFGWGVEIESSASPLEKKESKELKNANSAINEFIKVADRLTNNYNSTIEFKNALKEHIESIKEIKDMINKPTFKAFLTIPQFKELWRNSLKEYSLLYNDPDALELGFNRRYPGFIEFIDKGNRMILALNVYAESDAP